MRITLSRGALEAAVQTRGGELVSLRDPSGTEYIWQGDPAFWSGQNPILFPILGTLKDGTVDIGGHACEMSPSAAPPAAPGGRLRHRGR